MAIIGCSSDGHMDDTKFSKPMPWIGIYIAAASLACLITMAADLIHGIRGRKLWFPSKFFCLNATTLAIIAVAVKLSVDLNTPMPHRHDQLSKLSSNALVCTIMANSMTTLGITENKDTMMNLMAMALLVVTMIVNICIQFVTGVIYVFWAEHAVIMLLMLVLLMTMTSSAISIPKMKHYFELKYKMNEEALKEGSKLFGKEGNQIVERLRDQLMKIWMMTHTSSPQFVLGRSVTCTASGAFCLLSTVMLLEAVFRSYLTPWSFDFCTGDSDYRWSVILILIVQVAAVVVGTIAPAFRWFVAITYKCPKVRYMSCKRRLHVEGYWTTKLEFIKESPIGFRIHNRQYRKLAHDAKRFLLCICIKLQVGVVLICKATQYVSIYLMYWILTCCIHCKKFKSKLVSSVSRVSSGTTESVPGPNLDLRGFVLHLEGEEELVEVMMKQNRDATIHWVQVGEKNEPKLLIELLDQKCSFLEGFKGVEMFDSDQVLSLHCMEAAYSWSLPLVTLASIAVALPNINRDSVRKLVSTLNEGLHFVKLIENDLDKKGELSKLRMAAEIVWLGVDLYDKWLGVDLHEFSLQDMSPKETLEKLADAAKTRYEEFRVKYNHVCIKVSPSLWPIKVSASHTMYRICKTALLNHELLRENNSERLFEALTMMIADILGACLTNLPIVISNKCLNSTIEEKEDTVRHVVYILGKTKKIIEMLEKRAFPRVNFCQGTFIEDWRLKHKQNSLLHFVPSSLENEAHSDPPKSSDIYLDIN